MIKNNKQTYTVEDAKNAIVQFTFNNYGFDLMPQILAFGVLEQLDGDCESLEWSIEKLKELIKEEDDAETLFDLELELAICIGELRKIENIIEYIHELLGTIFVNWTDY